MTLWKKVERTDGKVRGRRSLLALLGEQVEVVFFRQLLRRDASEYACKQLRKALIVVLAKGHTQPHLICVAAALGILRRAAVGRQDTVSFSRSLSH